MKTNFNYFTISIFIDCEFGVFTKALVNRPYYNEAISSKKVIIYNENLQIDRYYNPAPGGHYESFSWWNSKLYPRIVFLSSNMTDGLDGISKKLRELLSCTLIQIRMSIVTFDFHGCFWFEYISPKGERRIIYAIEEDRWVFYEQGVPLPFENLDYYKRRRIKDRINNDIIIEYLAKCCINLFDIDSDVDQCMTLERKKWNGEK